MDEDVEFRDMVLKKLEENGSLLEIKVCLLFRRNMLRELSDFLPGQASRSPVRRIRERRPTEPAPGGGQRQRPHVQRRPNRPGRR